MYSHAVGFSFYLAYIKIRINQKDTKGFLNPPLVLSHTANKSPAYVDYFISIEEFLDHHEITKQDMKNKIINFPIGNG